MNRRKENEIREIHKKLKTYIPIFIGMQLIPIVSLYLSFAPRSKTVILIFIVISVLSILIFVKLSINLYKSYKKIEEDL